jgi:hypothetical protein
MYITLFDKNFNALGSNDNFVATQHTTKTWSLKRRAYEFDDFTVTCRGFRDSKNACFVGLFTDEGRLKYLSFCGIPKTENGLTTITGIDCRNIFNQKLPVNLGSASITSLKSLYEFLLTNAIGNLNLGISYEVVCTDISDVAWPDPGAYIERTLDARNIWTLIQSANALFDKIVVTSWRIDEDNNSYVLVFRVKNIKENMTIKLSDYDVRATRTNNVTNISCSFLKDFSSSAMLYLTNDNEVLAVDKASGIDQAKALFPPKAETYTADTLEEAITSAKEALYENRFMDRVVVDCNSRLGKRLEQMDLDWYGDLVGYNSADDNSVKRLPVSAISEDSKGSKKIEFGRLSEYWFLNRKEK